MPERTLGLLRIELNNDWSVAEFADLLKRLDYVYSHLNAFLPISEEFDQRIKAFTSDFWRHHNYPQYEFGRQRNILIHSDPEALFEPLLRAAARATAQLSLRSVQLHSPGWLELLAALPVLKFMADFYINYRKDETEREKIRSNERIETRKSEVEQSKVDAELFKTLSERETQLTGSEAGELMEQFIGLTRERPLTQLKQITVDRRIAKIEIVQITKRKDDGVR